MATQPDVELEIIAARLSGHISEESADHEIEISRSDGEGSPLHSVQEVVDCVVAEPPSPTWRRSDSSTSEEQQRSSLNNPNLSAISRNPTQEAAAVGPVPSSSEIETHNSHTPSVHPAASRSTGESPTWLPFSLRPSYLMTLALVSFALGLVCVALEVVSDLRSGLVEAEESNGFEFSWRFLPTIVAVLYCLPWMPIMKDVLRTEPYALMADQDGSLARKSILRESKPWFIEITLAIWNCRREPGEIRWAKFLAILAAMAGPLLVSPLSAGFLKVAIVPARSTELFSTFARPEVAFDFPTFTDVMYLSIVSNLIQKTSSSAWFTNSYAAAPFWPSETTEAPLNTQLAPVTQTWSAETDIFRLGLDCQRLITVNLRCSADCLLTLESSDGCFSEIRLTASTVASVTGTGFWGQFNRPRYRSAEDATTSFSFAATPIMKTYPRKIQDTSALRLYLTKSHLVSVATSPSGSFIEPDNAILDKVASREDSPFVNSTQFNSAFVNEKGSENFNYFITTIPQGLNPFIGPALPLATLYNYNISAMLATEPAKLIQDAQMIKQQFFNVALLSVFEQIAKTNGGQNRKQSGTIIKFQLRLLVIRGFGYSLGALLILLGSIAVALIFMTSLKARPLHLEHDPASPAYHALLLAGTDTVQSFERLDQAPAKEMRVALENHTFKIQDGRLVQITPQARSGRSSQAIYGPAQHPPPDVSSLNNHKFSGDWNPWYMKILPMLLFLGILLGCIAVLSWALKESYGPGIYEVKVLQSKTVTIQGVTVFDFSIYSVFPTLLAALIKIYWSSFDDLFRILTPFVAMLKEPQSPTKGALLSYLTVPIVWVSIVAAKKGHWILVLVTLGSLATEVLQITLSALWAVEPGVLTRKINLRQDFKLRTTPIVFERGLGDTEAGMTPAKISIWYPEVMRHLYGAVSFYDSWLFDGLVQMTRNKSSPAWSKGKWAFLPANLSSIVEDLVSAGLIKSQKTTGASATSLNATFETSALSGDLICTPYDDTRWLVKNWLENSGNKTSNLVNRGQWLTFYGYAETPFGGPTLFTSNFSIVWGFADHLKPNYSGPMFDSTPQVQAINCQPNFEKANVSVTVSVPDGKILGFELTGDPLNATEAWTHAFIKHFYSAADYDRYESIVMNPIYNETVSWGYLFHLALLQAGFQYGYGSYSRSVFMFDQKDLKADFYSVAALSQVGYNLTALLDASTLTRVSRNVFQTFFQTFISLDNGYNGYWAYEKFDEQLPEDMDYQPLVEVTTTYTIISRGDYCGSSTTSDCLPEGRDITTDTWTATYTTYPVQATSSSIASISTSLALLQPIRTTSASTVPPSVMAMISAEAPVLKLSTAAVSSSIFLFALLALLTIFAFCQQRKNSRMLPRNVEVPASVLAFVYASKKLQTWAMKKHSDGEWDDHSGTGLRIDGGNFGSATIRNNNSQSDMVALGHFGSNWGIEITERSSRSSSTARVEDSD